MVMGNTSHYLHTLVKTLYLTRHRLFLGCSLTVLTAVSICCCLILLLLSSGENGAVLYRDLLLRGGDQTGGTWFCFPQRLLPEEWLERHGLHCCAQWVSRITLSPWRPDLDSRKRNVCFNWQAAEVDVSAQRWWTGPWRRKYSQFSLWLTNFESVSNDCV